ncbi:tail fiber assembly protein [Escherichia sp. E4930]|uniref:tail fiber assembly protein n=1 Tax=Escherichia sp. E4930 TaxID=2044468 RepID=UPI00107EFCAF|nr:tail fiber assembly protein [Escherichia sp. E4930]TGB69159.1 phage tail protein [Escherichia sp. E4930]TLU80382.1 tail fiber assembly protein [Escherichia sp. E4930]
MAIYFSPSTNGFYNSDLQGDYENAGAWPDDLKEIADADYLNLLDGQASGLIILSDEDGYPVLKEPVINWQQKAEMQRQCLLAEAKDVISDWKTELELGIISDVDKARLTQWMAYIKSLKALDLSKVSDEPSFDLIPWTEKPVM